MSEARQGASCRPPGPRARLACLRLLALQASLFGLLWAALSASDSHGLEPAAIMALTGFLVLAIPASAILASFLCEGASVVEASAWRPNGEPSDFFASPPELGKSASLEKLTDSTIPSEDLRCALSPGFVPRSPNKVGASAKSADERAWRDAVEAFCDLPAVIIDSDHRSLTVAKPWLCDEPPEDDEGLWWLPDTVCVEGESGWQQAPLPGTELHGDGALPRVLALLETKAHRLDELLASGGDALDAARLVVAELIEVLRPWASRGTELLPCALQSSEIVLSVDFDFAMSAMADEPIALTRPPFDESESVDFDFAISAMADAPFDFDDAVANVVAEPEPIELTRPPFDESEASTAAVADDGIRGEIPSPERFRAEHARQRRDDLLHRLQQCQAELEDAKLCGARDVEDPNEDPAPDGELRAKRLLRRRDRLCEQLRSSSAELADALLELGEEEEPRDIPTAFTLAPTVHNIMHVTRAPSRKKAVSVEESVVDSHGTGLLSCGCTGFSI